MPIHAHLLTASFALSGILPGPAPAYENMSPEEVSLAAPLVSLQCAPPSKRPSGKSLFTSLNQDDAVAHGVTFACAHQAPTFRVREFHVHDIRLHPLVSLLYNYDRSVQVMGKFINSTALTCTHEI